MAGTADPAAGGTPAISGFRTVAAAPHPTIGRSMNNGAASHGSQIGIRED